MRLGLNCIHSFDSHYNTILLSEPQEGDVIFCVSLSGMSKDVVIPAKECVPVAKIIALTESEKSPLGQIANVCFTTVTDELNYHTDAMLARQVQSMIIDILFFSTSIRKGEGSMDRLSKSRHALSYLKY